MKRNLLVTTLVAVVMAAFVLIYTAIAPTQARPAMGGTEAAQGGVPGVRGYAGGWAISFVHTETSSPKIARILTGMTNSQVLVVPALARTPRSLLANVYAFTNGVSGGGPLHFQPDVFDCPPGAPCYRPLRALNLVTWKHPQSAVVLTSASVVRRLAAEDRVSIQQTGVVINIPFLSWPGGHR